MCIRDRRNGLIFIVNGAFSGGYVPTFMNLWNIDIFTFYGGYGSRFSTEP